MVRVWRIDESIQGTHQPCHRSPPEFVDKDRLQDLGIKLWQIDVDNMKNEGLLEKIIEEQGYVYQDNCRLSKEHSADYEKEWRSFHDEHLHADEEVRLTMAGSGYFDVRDRNDEWLRVEVSKGDLISIPAGMYHRFAPSKEAYISAMRLFPGKEPVWDMIQKPADDHPKRVDYMNQIQG